MIGFRYFSRIPQIKKKAEPAIRATGTQALTKRPLLLIVTVIMIRVIATAIILEETRVP